MGLLGMVTRPLASSTILGQPVVVSTLRDRDLGVGVRGSGVGARLTDPSNPWPLAPGPWRVQADSVKSATARRSSSSRYVSEANRTPDPWLLGNEHDWQCSQSFRVSC